MHWCVITFRKFSDFLLIHAIITKATCIIHTPTTYSVPDNNHARVHKPVYSMLETIHTTQTAVQASPSSIITHSLVTTSIIAHQLPATPIKCIQATINNNRHQTSKGCWEGCRVSVVQRAYWPNSRDDTRELLYALLRAHRQEGCHFIVHTGRLGWAANCDETLYVDIVWVDTGVYSIWGFVCQYML